MLEHSTIVWLPVPRDRLLDAYTALATLQDRRVLNPFTPEQEQMTAEAGQGIYQPPPEKQEPRKRPQTVSLKMVNLAKARVKRTTGPFTIQELRQAMGVRSDTSARTALKELEREGWVEQIGGRGQGVLKTYRYLPAEEDTVTEKPQDPPEVTGRGASGGGAPVAGTGNQQLRGEIGHLVGKLRKQGWTVKRTGGGHYRATNGRNVVVMSATPSDSRAMQNTISQLRKAGARV